MLVLLHKDQKAKLLIIMIYWLLQALYPDQDFINPARNRYNTSPQEGGIFGKDPLFKNQIIGPIEFYSVHDDFNNNFVFWGNDEELHSPSAIPEVQISLREELIENMPEEIKNLYKEKYPETYKKYSEME